MSNVSIVISRRRLLAALSYLAPALVLACTRAAPAPASHGDPGLAAWPKDDRWPEPYWRTAKPEVREAYRYAVSHPDVVRYFPCYCGCAHDGHTSNLDCYVKEFRPDGSVVLDLMSFG